VGVAYLNTERNTLAAKFTFGHLPHLLIIGIFGLSLSRHIISENISNCNTKIKNSEIYRFFGESQELFPCRG
jgi:hypothetical protein